MAKNHPNHPRLPALMKAPTGISGLDDITGGGVPRGRPTLGTGGAGCGKTLLSMEFLVRGAINHGEPGLFVAFEEDEQELTQNVASLGFDLAHLVKRRLLLLVSFARSGARLRDRRVRSGRSVHSSQTCH